eukprot:TRINITY_DN779934_c0_g1_i1.p1 TRINITY_DN779934_c0_g1~~TRINITY_DN779934_c0_g1_i1.p1  ORF type:complete len:217 (-),score=87.02 TRINITY_DN779934_c0_g1_i1:119-769(-)
MSDSEDNYSETDGDSQKKGFCSLTGMGNIMQGLLEQKVDKKAPILAGTKTKLQKAADASKKQKHTQVKESKKRKDKDREGLVEVAPKNRKDIDDKEAAGLIDKERELRKTATKGAVTLFNAIRKHQRNAAAALSAKVKRKDKAKAGKLLKASFMDMLKKPTPTENEKQQMESEDEEPMDTNWTALDEDYMQDARLSDWDGKEESSDDEIEFTDDDE